MGFWISLISKGEPCKVDRHSEGGVQEVGGSSTADMSVTYNYSGFWPKSLGDRPETSRRAAYGLGPWLDGRRASDTILLLRDGIDRLGDAPPDADYWASTAGNACQILRTLLGWARTHPEGVWHIHGG